MGISIVEPDWQTSTATRNPVALAAREGLAVEPRWLPPWLFYDAAGSLLFERITELPEYYLTRTERALLAAHAETVLDAVGGPVTLLELGAGTASKTGLLLRAAARRQGAVLFQPVDVSATALNEAANSLTKTIPELRVRAQIANYVTEAVQVERVPGHHVLALYIGSSIGNFTPAEAHGILAKLRSQLLPGDALLLGTDLAPGAAKTVARLLEAYDDRAGVTAAFNRNMLVRLNRELGTDFQLECWHHLARWNAEESRIEMHLESLTAQTVSIPASDEGQGMVLRFAAGDTIHTENSYKFSEERVARMLADAGFLGERTLTDPEGLFALTLAKAV